MLSKNQIKALSALKHKKFRKLHGKFLVEGIKQCEELLKSDYGIDALYICPQVLPEIKKRELLRLIQHKSIDVIEITSRELKQLSDTVQSQGVIALAGVKNWRLENLAFSEHALAVCLDGLADPGNLGTIIRTADWFGVNAILLGNNCVELYNPKVVRSTMGSCFHLPIVYDVDLKASLKFFDNHGFLLYATDKTGGKNINEMTFSNRSLILLGNESEGLSADLLHLSENIITIPGANRTDSLNVAVAAGIILHRLSNRNPSL
ncbi:RNA methyltransferase [candidate division KSB1 bacterium]|nr:RNA methyltransferase [candidate division KSB1 bacterium]